MESDARGGAPPGRWQPRDLLGMPGPVVAGTKNKRETSEERER